MAMRCNVVMSHIIEHVNTKREIYVHGSKNTNREIYVHGSKKNIPFFKFGSFF